MSDQYPSDSEPVDEVDETTLGEPGSPDGPPLPEEADHAAVAAERTADLQRLQAEYVNYKRRVDRDRDVARQHGIETVLADLLPVLDGIAGAREHDELTGGAKLIADEIDKVTAKHGLTAFGAVGDPFDPAIHDALMHVEQPSFDTTACAQVFQTGYRRGDKVLRPARVAVSDPSDDPEN